MSNQRYIRRPVEDAAIGRVDKKRSTVKVDRYRTPVIPYRENLRKIQTKTEMTDIFLLVAKRR